MLEYCIICRYSRTVGLPYQYCGIPHAIDEFLTFLTVNLRLLKKLLTTVSPSKTPRKGHSVADELKRQGNNIETEDFIGGCRQKLSSFLVQHNGTGWAD